MQIDRRVARTRTALYDALVALILSKGYEAISVQDILDEADVGRSTFYAHFTSKEDLLARSLGRLRAILLEAGRQPPGAKAANAGWSLVLFTHVAEYKDIYFALAGISAGQVLKDAIRAVIADFAGEVLSPIEGVPAELATSHLAATFMTVVSWWLERRRSLSPPEVDAMFRSLLTKGVELR